MKRKRPISFRFDTFLRNEERMIQSIISLLRGLAGSHVPGKFVLQDLGTKKLNCNIFVHEFSIACMINMVSCTYSATFLTDIFFKSDRHIMYLHSNVRIILN